MQCLTHNCGPLPLHLLNVTFSHVSSIGEMKKHYNAESCTAVTGSAMQQNNSSSHLYDDSVPHIVSRNATVLPLNHAPIIIANSALLDYKAKSARADSTSRYQQIRNMGH